MRKIMAHNCATHRGDYWTGEQWSKPTEGYKIIWGGGEYDKCSLKYKNNK